MSGPNELASLRERLANLERRERRRARVLVWSGFALALFAVAYSNVGFAADGNCPNAYPFCFGAGSPALASQVNHNFEQIQEWLEQKVGAVGNNNVTTTGSLSVGGSATVSGTATVGSTLTVNGPLNANNGLNIVGDLSVTGFTAGCYTRWGAVGCATGYTEVLRGKPGGHESYSTTGGAAYGNIECVNASASATQSWPGSTYFTRLMRAEADANGMDSVTPACSICCRGGCYTAYGTNTCAAGYTRTYEGRTGGVEGFDGGEIYSQTMCIDINASSTFTWSSGYLMRLMRHREGSGQSSDGMDSITNACAVCCK